MNRPLVVSTALGFTVGYVDTVGFVALFGLFTAHVTGNFVLIGSELAQPSHGVAIKLLAFPAFVAAVAGARVLALLAQRQNRSTVRPLLVLQCLLLISSMLCGWLARPIVDAGDPWALATGVLATAAMGVQNAAGRLAFSQLPPTTVMTGNVTQLVIAVVDLLRGARDAWARRPARVPHRGVRCGRPLWRVRPAASVVLVAGDTAGRPGSACGGGASRVISSPGCHDTRTA